MLTKEALTVQPCAGEEAERNARKNILRRLLAKGMTQVDVLDVLHERGTDKEEVMPEIAVRVARNIWATKSNDEVNVDDNALFSASDGGLWVSAWLYIDDSEIGHPR